MVLILALMCYLSDHIGLKAMKEIQKWRSDIDAGMEFVEAN